jgi:RNA polymerase primary sigma factor
LDSPLDADDRDSLERMTDGAAVDPEAAVIEGGLGRVLEESLARLDEREAEILRLRFGLGGGEARPLRAIAADWHMSPEGVRQISQRALDHLRAMPSVRGLSEYLVD